MIASGNSHRPRLYDALVIGAGQAGLATGYFLKKQGLSFLLLEAAASIGHSWRSRYDSLTLFTPAEYCQLPGLALGLPKDHYPSKDQIASYLQQYANHFQLPICFEETVISVLKTSGLFHVQTTSQLLLARQVVIATGPFQKPYVPVYPSFPDPETLQLHSFQYSNPHQLPAGPVLVVGGGNSGAQIAVELSQTHEVHLSARTPLAFSSLIKWGKSVFWWGTKTGALFAPPSSFLGKKLRQQNNLIYRRELERAVKSGQIKVCAEIAGFEGHDVLFKNGKRHAFNSIVWATGFAPDYTWLQVSGALNSDGVPLHEKGMSPVPGLYYVGLPWQTSRSSGLLLGAGRDAQFISEQMAKEIARADIPIEKPFLS